MTKPFATVDWCALQAPKSSNNTLLYAALGAGVVGAGAYYLYGTDATPSDRAEEIKTVGRQAKQVAGAQTGVGQKSKEDYQKVYNRIAETLEKEDYDGGLFSLVNSKVFHQLTIGLQQTALLLPFSFDWRGTLLVPTTRMTRRVVPTMLPCDSSPRLPTVPTLVW